MGLFDRLNLNDISSKLNDIAQSAIDQGSNFVGSTKSNFRLGDLEKQLSKLYAELGKKYYEQIKDAPAQEDQGTVTQIKDLLAQVEIEKAEARRLNGMLLCPNCGSDVPAGTVYCSKCGAVVPQPGVVSSVKCPGCGASLPAGTQFCTSCGTNVSNVQPTATQMPLGQVSMTGGAISSESFASAPQTFAQPAAPQTFAAAPAAAATAAAQTFTAQPAPVQPAAPVTVTPQTFQPTAPVTVAPDFLAKQPEPAAPAAQPAAPVTAAPQTVQPTAPVTVAPDFLAKQPEPAAPAAQPAAPVTVAPQTVQPTASVTVAPDFLAKQPEPAAPAAQPAAPVTVAPQTVQPTAPVTQQTFTPAAPATQQPSGFPNGGPGSFKMDIDTSPVFGSTTPSGGLDLNKN